MYVIFSFSKFSRIPKNLKSLKEKKATFQFPLFPFTHHHLHTFFLDHFPHLLSRAWTPVGGNTANLVNSPNFSRYGTLIPGHKIFCSASDDQSDQLLDHIDDTWECLVDKLVEPPLPRFLPDFLLSAFPDHSNGTPSSSESSVVQRKLLLLYFSFAKS